MREIKFRAWDTLEKKFIGEYTIQDCRFLGQAYHQNLEYLQYTGIKDKNGKEIYEGDVVQELYETGEPSMGVLSVVEWEAPSFVFKTKSTACYRPESCEILGNIYENPELLKSKKTMKKECRHKRRLWAFWEFWFSSYLCKICKKKVFWNIGW